MLHETGIQQTHRISAPAEQDPGATPGPSGSSLVCVLRASGRAAGPCQVRSVVTFRLRWTPAEAEDPLGSTDVHTRSTVPRATGPAKTGRARPACGHQAPGHCVRRAHTRR
eukprot:3149455-Prymnesium_polylepis.1